MAKLLPVLAVIALTIGVAAGGGGIAYAEGPDGGNGTWTGSVVQRLQLKCYPVELSSVDFMPMERPLEIKETHMNTYRHQLKHVYMNLPPQLQYAPVAQPDDASLSIVERPVRLKPVPMPLPVRQFQHMESPSSSGP